MGGSQIFDTKSGELLYSTKDQQYMLPLTDIVLSPNGKWTGDSGNNGYFLGPIPIEPFPKGVSIGVVFAGEYNISRVLTAVAFDPTGEWFYYAWDDGSLEFQERNPDSVSNGYDTDLEGPTLALAVDPTRRYIGVVTTEGFSLLYLQRQRGIFAPDAKFVEAHAAHTPAAGLAFSPDGALVVVATRNGWQLWSTAEGRLLAEIPQRSYAVTFSPDGRLLAVGDTRGVIHLWGMPQP
jgi:WD40 repeat protein